jgi:hypothetical protein
MNEFANIVLEKIIYEEMGVVFDAIVDAFTKINPDKTACRQIDINNAFKKAMRVKLYSIKMIFVKRRKYPHFSNKPKVSLSPQATFKLISDELSNIISRQSAFDAAIFLGSLIGMYIKTCPKELFIRWAESTNGQINSDTFLMAEAIASHVAMMVDY